MNNPVVALVKNQLAIGEIVKVDIHRALLHGGWSVPESVVAEDLIVNAGRTYIAKRIAGGDAVASAMAHIAVGTVATVASLNNTQPTGEVVRKATAINSAIVNNIFTAVATFGGTADSVTSLSLVEAAVLNHASSGEGTMMQRVTFAAVVLANSDILALTMETNVGSNTI